MSTKNDQEKQPKSKKQPKSAGNANFKCPNCERLSVVDGFCERCIALGFPE